MPNPPTPEEFNQAHVQAHDCEPSPDHWGLYAYSDGPPNVCGSGQGSFMWFATKDEMIRFTRDILAWWKPAPSSMDHDNIAEDVQVVVDSWTGATSNIEKLRDSLNESMKNMWQVPWWGQFKELTHGNSEFAVETRREFFDDTLLDSAGESGETVPPAIDGEDLAEFVQYLQVYGV